MADITAITAALSGIRHATDIVKFLRESNTSLEHAEQKLKLADLIESLSETRIQLADIQALVAERDQKIKELEYAFQSKSSLIKLGDAYYESDRDGKAAGDPYCMNCWQVNHKKYHLHRSNQRRGAGVCAHCKTDYTLDR